MLQMIGRPAHSDFRIEKLLSSVKTLVSSVFELRSEYRYFIEIENEGTVSEQDLAVLET